jgi:hypothetical protein
MGNSSTLLCYKELLLLQRIIFEGAQHNKNKMVHLSKISRRKVDEILKVVSHVLDKKRGGL